MKHVLKLSPSGISVVVSLYNETHIQWDQPKEKKNIQQQNTVTSTRWRGKGFGGVEL